MEKFRCNSSSICRNCLNPLDAALGDEMPKQGDISLCAYCLTVGKYDDELCVAPLSDIELDILERDHPETWKEIEKLKSILSK